MLLSSLELSDSNLNRYCLTISIRCYYLASDQVDIFKKYLFKFRNSTEFMERL